jgi:phospholipase C
VVTFDEWGGFFDHVRPAKAPDVSRLTSLRGFRVPTLLISPFARRGYVSHEVFDHTSILKMIEWRWGLPSLTPRDAAANNLADALAFDQPPNLPTPTFTVPPFTSPGCSAPPGAAASGAEYAEWPALRDLAVRLGWSLPS